MADVTVQFGGQSLQLRDLGSSYAISASVEEINGVAPTFDNTSILAVSLRGKGTDAGDTAIDCDASGRLTLGEIGSTGILPTISNTNADAITGTNRLAVMTQGFALAPDGSWDRLRSGADSGGGLGALLTSPTGHDYKYCTADAQVKASGGRLHSITINACTTAGVFTIYDNTAESGTVIGIVSVPLTPTPFTLHYDVQFSTGLYIGCDASIAVNLTVSYS